MKEYGVNSEQNNDSEELRELFVEKENCVEELNEMCGVDKNVPDKSRLHQIDVNETNRKLKQRLQISETI